MAKVKMSKNAASIDMTAMCDVAFLLLTFFILTATAKVPEPITVDTPSSTNKTKLPTDKLVVVTVGSGKENVFFDLKGREIRKRTLELMGDKYKMEFTEEEKNQFALIMGEDNLNSFHKWKNHDVILQHHDLYVYPRVTQNEDACHETLRNHPKIHPIKAPVVEISSTFIRESIKKQKNIAPMLPAKVADYIDKSGFYL